MTETQLRSGFSTKSSVLAPHLRRPGPGCDSRCAWVQELTQWWRDWLWLPVSLVSSSGLAPFSDRLSSPVGRMAAGNTMFSLFSNFSRLQNRCLWHGINLPWSVIFPEPVSFKGMWCTDQKDMVICHPKRHLRKLHLRPWGLRMWQGFSQRNTGSYNKKKSKWTGNSVLERQQCPIPTLVMEFSFHPQIGNPTMGGPSPSLVMSNMRTWLIFRVFPHNQYPCNFHSLFLAVLSEVILRKKSNSFPPCLFPLYTDMLFSSRLSIIFKVQILMFFMSCYLISSYCPKHFFSMSFWKPELNLPFRIKTVLIRE